MPARIQKLRVYVTRIGLTNWAVAAPSQKAALAAWDVRENLFASGAATTTNDARAVELAMKTPGKPVALDRDEKVAMGHIIRLDDHRKRLEARKPARPQPKLEPKPPGLKLSGSKAPGPKPAEAKSAARPKPETRAKLPARAKLQPKSPPPPPPKPPRPKPDRSRLTAAEDELRIFQKRAIRDRSELIREREALETRAQVLEARIEAEEKRLKSAIERERQRFEDLSSDD